MKNITIALLFLFTMVSCEEVVTPNLEIGDTRLVIEAKAERVFSPSGESEDIAEVILSTTNGFFDNSINFVNNAVVTLTNLETQNTYNLRITPNEGHYILEPNQNFVLENETEYLLNVDHNGETYQSTASLNVSVPIDNIFQFREDASFFDPEDVAINVTFTDLEEDGSHYIISFDNYDFISIDDEFISDTNRQFNFDYFYENPKFPTSTVYILGSDSRTNTYIDNVLEVSGGGANGPFSTVPFEVRGNIQNITTPENNPFGYFRVNELYQTQIDLVPNEEAFSLEQLQQLEAQN